jgi:hypothetical protein
MNEKMHHVDFWPIRQQELLLRASLMKGKYARDAWEELKSSVAIEKMEPGSLRMLPMLYRNLQTLGIDDPLISKLKGVYRRTWYENQILLQRLSVLLNSFHNADIATMILKGAALVLLHYKEYGLRPISHIDFLVRTKDALPAANLLRKLGMRAQNGFSETSISVAHAQLFIDNAGQEYDLHWHLLRECRYPHADDDFWEGAVAVKVNDVLTCALNPADQVLQLCLLRAKWDQARCFHWVADAMAVMNNPRNEIDWNRLAQQAKNRRLIIPLREKLNYLSDVLNAPIPGKILASIQNTPVSKMEHLEYIYRTKGYNHRPLGYLPILWFEYLRSLEGNETQNKFFGFLKYLQHYWGVKHQWQLPFYVIFMIIRRIQSITAWYWKSLRKN